MMKKRDLQKEIKRMAKVEGQEATFSEGGSHTTVQIGPRKTVVPRHNEINEVTAMMIIKQVGKILEANSQDEE